MSNFSRVFSAQPLYLSGKLITIETDITRGTLHAFTIVGLPDKAVEESRDRVGSAIKNSGFTSPKQLNQKTVVSLAPAEIKKEGSFFDLGIALGYLLSAGDIMFDPEGKIFLGELALNGEVKPIHGALLLAQEAAKRGFQELYVPTKNAEEAALIEDITVYPVHTLRDVIDHLHKEGHNTESVQGIQSRITPQQRTTIPQHTPHHTSVDFRDVRGQETAKRGLEIAASGGHNVALYGPPGTGKTMLARAFSGILPKMQTNDVLSVTGIHSLAGTLHEPFVTQPPFRSPHHTSSYVSIIGGGTYPKPGEITLAHKGVLFMDEFPEFDKRVLESLRQPLEDCVVHISRAQGSASFPADFILIAAMNPCPCGFFGALHKSCTCTPGELARYKRKLSGPIIDRIDIWLPVEHVDYKKLGETTEQQESGETIRKRVQKARERQQNRYSKRGSTTKLNSGMSVKDLEIITIEQQAREILHSSARKLSLSPRSYHRTLKLARTIADLSESDNITTPHILEALQYRPKLML